MRALSVASQRSDKVRFYQKLIESLGGEMPLVQSDNIGPSARTMKRKALDRIGQYCVEMRSTPKPFPQLLGRQRVRARKPLTSIAPETVCDTNAAHGWVVLPMRQCATPRRCVYCHLPASKEEYRRNAVNGRLDNSSRRFTCGAAHAGRFWPRVPMEVDANEANPRQV